MISCQNYMKGQFWSLQTKFNWIWDSMIHSYTLSQWFYHSSCDWDHAATKAPMLPIYSLHRMLADSCWITHETKALPWKVSPNPFTSSSLPPPAQRIKFSFRESLLKGQPRCWRDTDGQRLAPVQRLMDKIFFHCDLNLDKHTIRWIFGLFFQELR